MDDRSIARWRLHSLRLAGQSFDTPEAAVGGLLGVQAENYAQTCWALAERTAGPCKEGDLHRLHDDGVFLRTHVLRPTWHFALPDDLRWLLELTAPRVRPLLRRQLALDDAGLEGAVGVVVQALEGGRHATRAELAGLLRDAGHPTDGMAFLMGLAEFDGVVCSGARRGEHTYALLSERAPHARRLTREEALAEIALRYFTSHGPATDRDLAYWATLTLTDVRKGIAAVRDELSTFEHDGRTYWFGEPEPEGTGPLEPRGHLLHIFDEYFRGVQDSRHVLDAHGAITPGRAAALGMVLVDGQMVGDMRRTVRATEVVFDATLVRALTTDEHDALDAAAHRYGAFLDRTPVLNLSGPERR